MKIPIRITSEVTPGQFSQTMYFSDGTSVTKTGSELRADVDWFDVLLPEKELDIEVEDVLEELADYLEMESLECVADCLAELKEQTK